jgi:hypothetical protein
LPSGAVQRHRAAAVAHGQPAFFSRRKNRLSATSMVLALRQTLVSNDCKRTGNSDLAFDEMIDADGSPRGPYKKYFEWFNEQDHAYLMAKARDAEDIFRKTGITFAVYGHEDAAEKIIPFDLIPRIISGSEWSSACWR